MTEADFLAALADAPDDLDLYRVYADWLEDRSDMRAAHVRQLVRVKELLPQVCAGSATWSHFTLQPCLDETDLATWETTNEVTLPEPYRLFLRHVGNGAHMPSSYTDFVLHPLAPPQDASLLREVFPITGKQDRERLAAEDALPGCLQFGRYPSYDALFLVLTGKLRGSVWCSAYLSAPECQRNGMPHDFLTWFEEILLTPDMREG